MRRGMKKFSVIAGLVLLGLALASPAVAATWRGVLVGKERVRHALLIADRGGIVRTVRAGPAYGLRPGARVAVRADRLADGTFKAERIRLAGRAVRARVVGTVIRTQARRYLLSVGASVVAVRRGGSRVLSAEHGGLQAGDRVVVDVVVGQGGNLVEQAVETVGHGAEIEMTGLLTALTNATASVPGSVEITVQTGGATSAATPTTFSCIVPAGSPDLSALLNTLVEAECNLENGQWILSELGQPGKDEVEDDEDETEVTGTITGLVHTTAASSGSVTVDPDGDGPLAGVTCTVPAGFDTLGFNVGDTVEVECENGVLMEFELEEDENSRGKEEEEEEEEEED